jgi:uncharacterized BrkB/YihY/UPF0761 family membrane protein
VTRRIYALMVERFRRNNILTYSSAIAFHLLVALLPRSRCSPSC